MTFSYLKAFMDGMVSQNRTPNCSVCVYLDGKQVYQYSVGFDDLEKTKPITGEELYNIYSCSKVATVTAGMQLIEQGRMMLTDPLSEYLPEYADMTVRQEDGSITPAKNPITVADLFSMTAGFNYERKTPAHEKARLLTNGHMNTRTVVRCMAENPLCFEPGTHWRYSLCHDVLAALIEEVSGMLFRDYMKQSIFEPLGMNDTCYHHTPETLARTAQQYRFAADAEPQKGIVDAQMSGCSQTGHFVNVGKDNDLVLGDEYDSGGAGIITSVTDYAKLMNALANGGVGTTGERILSRQAIDLMRTNRLSGQLLKDLNWQQLRGCGYGLGVRTHIDPVSSGCISSLGEFGWGGAAGATCIIDPAVRLGVFFVQHTLAPREEYYQPRLRSVVYTCLD